MAVQIDKMNILAMLDTGSVKTILRSDEYKKIGSPTLRPTARMFKGFGNARSKAIVFDAELMIQGEVYRNEVYVVPIEAMDVKMLLGKDLHRQMDILILSGQTTIQKIATKVENGKLKPEIRNEERSQYDHIKGESDDKDDAECMRYGLSTINYIEPSEINVHGPCREEIRKLMDDYKPNQQVQTNIETRIVLKDQEPVCAKPRRLPVQENRFYKSRLTSG